MPFYERLLPSLALLQAYITREPVLTPRLAVQGNQASIGT